MTNATQREKTTVKNAVAVILALGAAVAVQAETLPSAVDGVITLDVPAATTNVYSGALEGATKVVKTGRGWAVLGTATTAFTGTTEVQEGVLKITDAKALGASPSVDVTSGAVFFLNITVTGGQNTLQFPGSVTIAGTGCDGMGAIHFVPGSGSNNACPDNLVKSLALSADATVYVPNRWGLYGSSVFKLNGHTLTRAKVATKNPDFIVNNATVEPGTFRILGNSHLTLQGACTWTGDDTDTAIELAEGGYIYFWGASNPTKARVDIWTPSSALQVGSGGAGRNILAGPVTVYTNATFDVGTTGQEIRIDGTLDLHRNQYDANLIKSGAGTLVVNGDILSNGSDQTGNSKNYMYTSAGWTYLTNDARRVLGSWNFNGTGSGLLGGGYLWSGMLRVANGSSKGLFRQTGGVYCNRPGDCAYIGETGSSSTTSYGAYVLEGGEAHFSNSLYIAANTLSRGLVVQKGGRFIHSSAGAVDLGRTGDGWMHVAGGTNETRGNLGVGVTTFRLSPNGGSAVLAVTGSNTLFHSACLTMGNTSSATTNVIAVADGAQFKLDRFMSVSNQSADSRNDVFFDGGIVYPTFLSGWNHCDPANTNFYRRSPTWYVGPNGMTIDTSECLNDKETTRGSSLWPHPFTSPTGKGFASVTLPTDSTFAALSYFQPAVLRFEGTGHGAAGYVEFDFATKKLGRVVILSPGCGYDETAKVYVEHPDCRQVYACTYTLADAESGPVVYRGGAISMYPTNTYTGATVVESGTLTAVNVGSVPVNGALEVKKGATLNANAKTLTVSSLKGAGKITNANPVEVTGKLVVRAADLFTAKTPLTVEGTLALGAGVTFEVEDPENLAGYAHDASVAAFTATTLTGSVAFTQPAGVTGVWQVFRVGETLKFGMVHGTMLILR